MVSKTISLLIKGCTLSPKVTMVSGFVMAPNGQALWSLDNDIILQRQAIFKSRRPWQAQIWQFYRLPTQVLPELGTVGGSSTCDQLEGGGSGAAATEFGEQHFHRPARRRWAAGGRTVRNRAGRSVSAGRHHQIGITAGVTWPRSGCVPLSRPAGHNESRAGAIRHGTSATRDWEGEVRAPDLANWGDTRPHRHTRR